MTSGTSNGAPPPSSTTQPPATATSATVFDLLETLPRISLDRLYGLQTSSSSSSSSNPYPWTCRAVFQSLTPLAKQYVMRLLCLETGVSSTCLESWVEPQYLPLHQRALGKLDRLRILHNPNEGADDEATHPPTYTLNPHFRENLRAALSTHLAGPWSDPGIVLKPDSDPKTPLQLESYMCAKVRREEDPPIHPPTPPIYLVPIENHLLTHPSTSL